MYNKFDTDFKHFKYKEHKYFYLSLNKQSKLQRLIIYKMQTLYIN